MNLRNAGAVWLTREPSRRRLRECFLLETEYNAPIYLSLFEPAEHVIDGFQRQSLNCGLHFAVSSKRKRLFQVQASANDGAPYRVAVRTTSKIETGNSPL